MNATQKRNFWAKIEDQITSGNPPKVFVTASGSVALDGSAMELPPRLRDMLPADIVAEARRHAAQRAAEQQKEAEERMAAWRQREAELNARLDEPGFALLAGEDTTIVRQGTLRECREALPLVVRCRRNSDVGLGCWVIVDADGLEVEAGQFSKHGLI